MDKFFINGLLKAEVESLACDPHNEHRFLENVKTKHPNMLYGSKIYRILQVGSMEDIHGL